ncbi:hypothetical protein GLE_5294 [Lysobacter enzymogenes]|uniref:Uncharacterized protein n=1 Tax=Lysobacter enzymogenes TaxID=69 RepID=A0A0S2DPH9_LYSEN|nr:hypothetical protein [Lysobacter enzymogenes]ALN60635.1 hypothetical protein GLE_5294 [Lysobacter enzymogenes]
MYPSVPRVAAIRAARRHRHASALAALVLAAALPGVRAAGPGADPTPGADTTVVIARTVHPRIAYRALPAQDNPVRTEATTFPGQVFHATLSRSLAPLDDAALGQHGSGGLGVAAAADAASAMLVPAAATGAGATFAGPGASAPLGASASVGGAVVGATAGLGDTLTGAVMQALAPPPGSGR